MGGGLELFSGLKASANNSCGCPTNFSGYLQEVISLRLAGLPLIARGVSNVGEIQIKSVSGGRFVCQLNSQFSVSYYVRPEIGLR
jgi:hypothetical protein